MSRNRLDFVVVRLGAADEKVASVLIFARLAAPFRPLVPLETYVPLPVTLILERRPEGGGYVLDEIARAVLCKFFLKRRRSDISKFGVSKGRTSSGRNLIGGICDGNVSALT